MNHLHRYDDVTDARHDLGRKLEAQIHVLRADVKEEIAWRGHGVAASRVYLPERMQFGWPRRPEELIPGVGSERGNARKSCFEIAKFHRAKQASDVSAKRPQGRAAVRCRLYGQDEENCRARQR